MSQRSLARLVAPGLLMVLMAATGCGSDTTKANDVPSLNGSSGNATKSTTTTTVDPEKAVQKFVACLREQGLDVADPKVGSDGQIDMRSIFESSDIQPGSDQFRTVQEKCGKYLANAGFGPSESDRADRQKAMLAFTACLRKEGLTVGDMTFDGPGGRPGQGAPNGSTGSSSGSSTTVAGSGASQGTTQTPPAPPARDGGPATEEERTAFLAERLGLDSSDPAVTAAFSACNTELTAATARPGRGSATTTTTAG